MERKMQWCYVGNTEKEVRNKENKRIFVADIGGKRPIVVVTALSEPFYIQGHDFDTITWECCELIKEPEYIPFDATNIDDVKRLLNKPLIHKTDGNTYVVFGDISNAYTKSLFKNYTFEDGTPVGKLKL